MIIQVFRTVNSSTCARTFGSVAQRVGSRWNRYRLKLNGTPTTVSRIKSTLANQSSVSMKEDGEEKEVDMFVEPRNVSTPPSSSSNICTNQVPDHRSATRTVRMKSDNQGSNYFNYKSDEFVTRHIGPREHELNEMAKVIGFKSVDEMINATVPSSIRCQQELDLNGPMTESELLERLQEIGSNNRSNWRSFIGMGYYNCHTPPVIMRNVLENPGE